MISEHKIAQVLSVVVRSLRKEFPEDFYKRCAYAALGTRALLSELGINAEIVGGDFVAFVVATDNSRGGLQGFGGGQAYSSHFWVLVENRLLVDVGPHLLPAGSSYPIAKMPLVAWDFETPLPAYLRYRALERFPAGAPIGTLLGHEERSGRFVESCRKRAVTQVVGTAPVSWLLTGERATYDSAKRQDKWSIGALRFADLSEATTLPF
jgi:hypothetical protein